MRFGKNNNGGNGGFGSDNLPTKKPAPGSTSGGRLSGPPPGRFGGNGGNGNGKDGGIGGGAGRAAPTMRGIPKDDHDRMLDRCLGKPER